MRAKKIISVVGEIISLYDMYGNKEYAGEPISQMEHMMQSAQMARDAGYDDEIVLAAFLHDIGHICSAVYLTHDMNGFGIMNHEKIGANFLRKRGFSERIAKLVENHVAAKRYLTYKFPEYVEQLSEASKKTLELQGGKMSETEADQFERDELFEKYIEMRRWDEMAKEVGRPIPSIGYYKDLMIHYLQRQYSFNQI